MRSMSGWGLLAIVLSWTVVAAGMAQERGTRGEGGRRRGFGGMMMRGFGGPDLAGLLRIDKVREELDLLDEQIADLKKLGESSRRPRGERPDFRNMSNEERSQFFAKMRSEAEKRRKEMEAKIKEILLPEQWERLQQIKLQASGVRALLQKEVQVKLKVTEEQAKKLAAVAEEQRTAMREKMRELFQTRDRDKIREAITAAQKEFGEKLLAVLTDAQREAFEKLKGKPFELPRSAFFGGRRGGRGRGGPGRRGPGGPQGGNRPRPE